MFAPLAIAQNALLSVRADDIRD